MNWTLEVVVVPVSDVDRAKAFYAEQLGFHVDHDVKDAKITGGKRIVQLTPPGSACSISLGVGLSDMPPGSQKGIQVVVEDVAVEREQLLSRGVEASEVDAQPWGSFVTFSDPDGNMWALQQLPPRP